MFELLSRPEAARILAACIAAAYLARALGVEGAWLTLVIGLLTLALRFAG